MTSPEPVRDEPHATGTTGAESPPRTGARSLLDRIAFGLLLVMVAAAPLPDGSVELSWISIWTGVAALVVLLASYGDLPENGARILIALLLVIAAYILVGVLQSVSPGPLPLAIWAETSAALGTSIPPLSGTVRDAPIIFFGRPLLAALVFTAGMVLGSDRRRAALLLSVVVATACFYSAIGLIALSFSITALRPFNQDGSLTVFFINRNTTATYLGSAFLISLALITGPMRSGLKGRDNFLAMLVKPANRRLTLMTAAAFLLAVLIPLTKSRAGLILTVLLSLAVLLPLLRSLIRKRGVLIVVVLGMFALIYVLSGEDWRQRQARAGLDSVMRVDAYISQVGAIIEHPWLGLGLGSFNDAFPQFRSPEHALSGRFNIGHSSPLELAFEGGLPLTLVVVSFTLLCAAVLVRGLRRRPHDPYILAALLVGILGIAHSCVDFSLQIPGYVIIYMAVVGMGIGRALRPAQRSTPPEAEALRATSTGDAPIHSTKPTAAD